MSAPDHDCTQFQGVVSQAPKSFKLATVSYNDNKLRWSYWPVSNMLSSAIEPRDMDIQVGDRNLSLLRSRITGSHQSEDDCEA